jgi:hypothetical protein
VTSPIDRRHFLLAGAGAVAAGLAGCSSSKGTIKVAKAATATTDTSASGPGPFTVLADVFNFFAGIDQRVAVALATSNGDPIHPTGPVSLQIGPLNGPLDPPVQATLHRNGLANPYLLTTHRFASPGTYVVRASYQGQTSDLPIEVVSPSSSAVPLVGRPMIMTATPTTADPGGVNPVCTAQPPCPLHQTSLDTALKRHDRTALLFATPALCQSRFCGPVLDNLVATHQPFADRVTFIHCEIFTDLSGANSTAPVTAYHLEHEPMLLLAGPDGVVRTRLDNAFDRDEATAELTKLVST